jgi:hypothetical protein
MFNRVPPLLWFAGLFLLCGATVLAACGAQPTPMAGAGGSNGSDGPRPAAVAQAAPTPAASTSPPVPLPTADAAPAAPLAGADALPAATTAGSANSASTATSTASTTGATAASAASADPLAAPRLPVATGLPAPHYVAPASADEIARKRAEWEEHVRQTEQADRDLESWRRSRSTASDTGATRSMPRVGAATTQPDPAEAALRTWHQTYWAKSAAVRLALSQMGMAMGQQPRDVPRVHHACTELATAVDTLAADPQALAAPQASISRPLTTAYGEIKAAATACLAEHPDAQAAHLAAARQAMSDASAALRPYQMQP